MEIETPPNSLLHCEECNSYSEFWLWLEWHRDPISLCRPHLFQLRELLDKIEDEHETVDRG